MTEIITKEKEQNWWMSRRLWAASLNLMCIVAFGIFPDKAVAIGILFSALASILGITSWTVPAK